MIILYCIYISLLFELCISFCLLMIVIVVVVGGVAVLVHVLVLYLVHLTHTRTHRYVARSDDGVLWKEMGTLLQEQVAQAVCPCLALSHPSSCSLRTAIRPRAY